MNSVKALTIALAFGIASVSVASAATVTVTKQNSNIFQGAAGVGGLLGSIGVTFTAPGGNRSGGAGGFQMKAAHDFDGDGKVGAGGAGDLENFVAFCITPFTWLNTNVKQYDVLNSFTPNLSPLSTAQLKSLGGLAKGAWGLIADKTTAVAFQLAVWEIVAETSGTYDVTKDTFKLVSPSSAASASAALANTWLASLGTSGFETSTKGLTILSAPVDKSGKHLTQDFVTYNPPAPVPLPGAFGFLALGLATLVAKGRARRS